MNLREQTYLWYLSVLRIYVGYYLLAQGIRKYQREFPKGDWIGRQIGDIGALDIYPWYRNFLSKLCRTSQRAVRLPGDAGRDRGGNLLASGAFHSH